MPALSFVDHLARAAGDADLAATIEGLVADPRRLPRLRVDMRDVGHVDRQLLVDDAAGVAHPRLGMPARHVDALDNEPPLDGHDAQHLARLPLVAAGDDDDRVALFDLQLWHRAYSTSGASETIFIKRRA